MTVTHLFAVGLETQLQPAKTIYRGDEAIDIPPHTLVISRLMAQDGRLFTCLSGYEYREGMDPSSFIDRALEEYPVDGREIRTITSGNGTNIRAVCRKSGDANRIRKSRLWVPPNDAVDTGVNGDVSGWGLVIDQGNRGWYLGPYLAVQCSEEDARGNLRPVTVHARLYQPRHRDTKIEPDEWLFYGPDGQVGDIPELFQRLREKYHLGTHVSVDMVRPSNNHKGYYLLSRVESELSNQLAAVAEELRNAGPRTQPAAET
jgi:hypothetical protein